MVCVGCEFHKTRGTYTCASMTQPMEEIFESEIERKMKATAVVSKSGLNKAQLMEEYKKWETDISYDKVAKLRGYNGPQMTAQSLSEQIVETERKTYKIIDVGAGTGLVGEELQKVGFQTIDALEPSEDLLKTAKSKNVYQNYFQCFMSEATTPGLRNDSYDGLVSCGCFLDNHLPVRSIDEMIRIVKPDGIIVITTRFKYLETVEAYKDKLEPYMIQLEEEGKWKMISRSVFPKYYRQDEGILWLFKAL